MYASSVARRHIVGGYLWIGAVQFFIAQVVVQLAWQTPFSLATNYISDLGNTLCGVYPSGSEIYVCSPLHAVMNLSFFIQGVIILAGTLLLTSAFHKSIVKDLILILLILTGIGMLGVGIFPENENNKWHVYSAALQFITGNLALVVIGLFRATDHGGKAYWVLSILLGLSGLAATGLFASGNHFGLGVGGMERVAAYTFPVWLIYSGILIILRSQNRAA